MSRRDRSPLVTARRRRLARQAFWMIALGGSVTAALTATYAAGAGTVTAPWVVAFYAWLVVVWMIVAAFRSDDSR